MNVGLLTTVVLASLLAIPVLPAFAADATAPRVIKAQMLDADRDDRTDRVLLTYSERINHALDSDGRYPFAVAGYTVKGVLAASKTPALTILIAEKTASDISAKPSVKYTRTTSKPVKDLAGNQAVGQTLTSTIALDVDGDGATSVGNDCAPTNPVIGPLAQDDPDRNFVDTNCDGFDGDPRKAYYVSVLGSDDGTGSRNIPFRSLQYAIDRAAAADPVRDVYVGGGTYRDHVLLSDNVGLFGAFIPGGGRSLEEVSEIRSPNGQLEAVLANGADNVTLQLLTIKGADATVAGGSVYGLRVIGGSSLTLDTLSVSSGHAANGVSGFAGANGSNGSVGAPGSSYNTNQNAPGGAGGGGELPGGAGGTSFTGNPVGQAGFAGAGGASGGHGGPGGVSASDTAVQSHGSSGGPGVSSSALGVTGSGATFSVASADAAWSNFSDAGPGSEGGLGGGGGGGGAGGGAPNACGSSGSYPGGGGGGGGGGGSGGPGGTGGANGGGSFAVYVHDSTVDIQRSVLTSGDGGHGGPGGNGGAGGAGGAGGSRGFGFSPCGMGDGGVGGRGGNGANGGSGGGGAGGPVAGVFAAGTGSFTTTGTTVVPGTAGSAGAPNGQSGQILP